MRSAIIILIVLLCTSRPLSGATVAQVTFDQMVTSSEFVFQGRVINTQARFDGVDTIHTYVTMEVQDVLKGTYANRTIELRYLGGTVGDLTLEVADSIPPVMGETGIYFLESLARPQVHPLYGWDQGHFLVIRNNIDLSERIFSRSGKPITGFAGVPAKAIGLSNGIALGLTASEQARPETAMTLRDFKQKVMELKSRR